MNKKIYILVAMVCAGCSAESRNLAELRRLCEEDAGFMLYRSVQADGYYDTTATSGVAGKLVTTNYNFFEYCNESPTRFDVIPEAGCYRVEKVQRVEGACHEAIDESLSEFIVEPYPEFLAEYCVSVEKIETPRARYSYHSELEAWYADNDKSRFTKSRTYIEDENNSEILGEYISYSFTETPGVSIRRSCNDIDSNYPSFLDTDFFNKIISPNMEVQ